MPRHSFLVLAAVAWAITGPAQAATALGLTLAPLPAPLQGTVHLVDVSGPPGSYPTVQDAVDAAAEGDTVFIARPEIVAANLAAGFVLDGKGLTILASPGNEWVLGSSLITHLPDGSAAVLHGLAFHARHAHGYPYELGFSSAPPIGVTEPGLRVEACAGIVSIDLCVVSGSWNVGMRVLDSDLVTMRRVSVAGGQPPAPFTAFDGLEIERSRVDAEGCAIFGGSGGSGDCSAFGCSWCTGNGDGGDAVRVGQGAVLFASSCYIRFGYGGICGSCWTCDGLDGVTARIESGGRLVERNTEPQSSLFFDGPVHSLTDAARELQVPASVGPDGVLQLRAIGVPGEVVYVLMSGEGGLHAIGADERALMVGTPLSNGRRRLGTIGPDNTLVIEGPLGLPLDSGAQVRHLQLAFLSPTGTRFSNAATVIQAGDDAPFLAESEVARLDPHASTFGSGRHWTSPLRNLTEAKPFYLGHVQSGLEFWLKQGDFLGDELGELDFADVLRLMPGTTLLGGFIGSEQSPDERDLTLHRTRLSGDLMGDDGPGFTNRSDNMGRLFLGGASHADNSWPANHVSGIDFSGFGASTNAFDQLGAFRLRVALSMSHCRISNSLLGTAFADCTEIDLAHTAWLDNHGTLVFTIGSGPLRIRESLVVGNTGRASLFVSSYGDLVVEGVTATGNRVQRSDGAVFWQRDRISNATTRVHNCILFRNIADGRPTESANVKPNALSLQTHDLAWSLVEGWSGTMQGSNILDLDPLFVDTRGPDGILFNADGDYRLDLMSPCIDAGNNAAVLSAVTLTDLEGMPRRNDIPGIPDTGNGAAPVVDLGAFEKRL